MDIQVQKTFISSKRPEQKRNGGILNIRIKMPRKYSNTRILKTARGRSTNALLKADTSELQISQQKLERPGDFEVVCFKSWIKITMNLNNCFRKVNCQNQKRNKTFWERAQAKAIHHH